MRPINTAPWTFLKRRDNLRSYFLSNVRQNLLFFQTQQFFEAGYNMSRILSSAGVAISLLSCFVSYVFGRSHRSLKQENALTRWPYSSVSALLQPNLALWVEKQRTSSFKIGFSRLADTQYNLGWDCTTVKAKGCRPKRAKFHVTGWLLLTGTLWVPKVSKL